VSDENKKNGFDEQTLARVLEAAYVLQEHQHELEELKSSLDLQRKQSNAESAPAAAAPTFSPAPPTAEATAAPILSPASAIEAAIAAPTRLVSSAVPGTQAAAATDYSSILARVMETQSQIEAHILRSQDAMVLVADQLIDICGAAGAAIALANRNSVQYRAVAGIRTLPSGSEVSLDEALCAPCLASGQVFRCANTNSENLMQREECRRRGIGSLIAAPVFHDGKSVGALELLFSDAGAFTEQDAHACQLMAGILTEALSRDPELSWKEAPGASPPRRKSISLNRRARTVATSAGTCCCPASSSAGNADCRAVETMSLPACKAKSHPSGRCRRAERQNPPPTFNWRSFRWNRRIWMRRSRS
jgi:GAF domain-containing protein